MDDVAVALEHVDLLYRLDGLNVHLLERSLELLVVCARRLVHLLDGPPGSTLASVKYIVSRLFLQVFGEWSGGQAYWPTTVAT